MKLTMKPFSIFLMAVVLFSSIPMDANNPAPDVLEIPILLKRAKWAGVWDYTVQDVPPEYSKGVLHITKKKRVHSVQIELPGGTIDGENVVVAKKELNFSLSIEGQMVEVSLTMDGDNFSGESSSPDGVFSLQGTRRN